MTPRQRRLRADFDRIISEFSAHPYISVNYNAETGIPEQYFIEYKNIKGLKQTSDSSPQNRKTEITTNHRTEIYLHADYPRVKPVCYMLSDIFHPNFRMAHPHDICIGDYWASGETLADVIYMIGEMIQYKNFSSKNPLNGVAAKWAMENQSIFPVDETNIRIGDEDLRLQNKIDIEIKSN